MTTTNQDLLDGWASVQGKWLTHDGHQTFIDSVHPDPFDGGVILRGRKADGTAVELFGSMIFEASW